MRLASFQNLAFAALLLSGAALSGCGPKTYPLTSEIIGTWKVTEVIAKPEDGGEEITYEPEGEISFTFNEDETFTAVNNEGDMEKTLDSNPFRTKGTHTGHYLVSAPAGMKLRVKYRGPVFYSAVRVEGNTLTMSYTSYHDDQDVVINLTK